MTLAQLRFNRRIWRVREVSNFQKSKGRSRRALYQARYVKSRDKRRWYDDQIHKALSHSVEEISQHGVAFIAGFEGFSGSIYNDGTGVMTVGYGHTEEVHSWAVWIHGQKHPGRLTQSEAMRLLKQDLNRNYAPAVRALHLPLKQNQFDALVSFTYNVGTGGVGNTAVGRDLRNFQYHAAANALLQWDRAGGQVLAGLVRRREAERAMFLS